MDAKLTKPPKATGSMANIHDRAASTILGVIEPNPPRTGRPWVGGAVYAPRAARYVAFQLAEVAIPRDLFADILRMIAELRPPPLASTS